MVTGLTYPSAFGRKGSGTLPMRGLCKDVPGGGGVCSYISVTSPTPSLLPSGHQYWLEPVGSSVTLADLTVTLMDQQDLADMVIRTFHLSKVSCPAVPCPPTTDTWLLVMWRERLLDRSLLQSLEGVCVHLVEWTDLLLVCSSSVKTEVGSDM